MSAKPVQEVFKFNKFVFNKNLEGISHEESTRKLNPDVSTINWVTGHVVLTRDALLETLGKEALCGDEFEKFYERGSNMLDASNSVDLAKLIDLYNSSQDIIMEALSKEEDEEKINECAGFGFHEAYHAGQLGILRKLLGKEGKIQ